MSRSAWVIHMSAVTLAQMTRNAPSVVRRIYRPMDPIDLRVPARDEATVPRALVEAGKRRQFRPLPRTPDQDYCGIGTGLIASAKPGSTFGTRAACHSRGDEPYAWPPGA